MDVNPTWDEIRQRIVGLWPKFNPTDAERSLIADRLSRLNRRWLSVAVEEYRCESSSTVFKVAELLVIYKRISSTGSFSEARSIERDPKARKQADEDALARDEVVCRRELQETERGRIAKAVADLRQAGWIRAAKLPPRLEEWTRQQVFLVVARLRSEDVVLSPSPKGLPHA